MDPFTIGLTIAATGLQAFGKLSAGASSANAAVAEGDLLLQQANLYGLNADTAKFNAEILSKQAEIAELGEDFAYAKARLQKGRISEAGRVTMAAQRTEFAGRNIDPTFGSPLVAQAVTAGRIAQDLDLTDAGAAVEAADAKSRAANIRGQAVAAQGQVVSSLGQKLTASLKSRALFSKSGDDVMSGVIGAASSLLSGAAKLGGGFGAGGSEGVAGTIDVGGSSYVAFR